MPYLAFSDSLEQPEPNEQEVFVELSKTMQHITRTMASHYRHAYRPVHAKSHGLLVGTLQVDADLSEPLAQGLFREPKSYPVILRFSTNPGDLLADSVSSPRGLAIKVLNVQGEMLPSHSGNTTQDIVCVNAKAFGTANAAGFLQQVKLLDKTLEYPESVKQAVSTVARGANTILRAVGIHSGPLDNLGHPYTHILGETFSTVAPIRYGGYVAKLAIVPVSANLKELTGKHIDAGHGFNPLEDAVREFFAGNTATWEIQAQLALDLEATPIEDASVPWPEDQTPYQRVATLTVSPQESYSDARQVFIDEHLSFSPWHALAAHRPLGGIMRARRNAYEEAQRYRAARNVRVHVEPNSIDEVPA
jgi:catalase